MDAGVRLARSHRTNTKVAAVLQKRIQTTNERFARRVNEATTAQHTDPLATMAASMDPRNWYSYAVDAAQRSILFWDTLRQRGNNFVEHSAQGLKPVLHFEYEIVIDGRTLERPVNYALLRIMPPAGVTVDPSGGPTSSSIRAPAMAPASAASRTIRRSASRCAPAIRSTSSFSFAIPSPARRCSTSATPSRSSCRRCARCIPTAPSPRSSATARAAGRR